MAFLGTPSSCGRHHLREDASPAPMLTHRAGLGKMSVELGKEAEICISLII